jgi:hypothetical protein
MSSLMEAEDAQRFTYVDVLEWDEGERCELFDGELYMMAPPTRMHHLKRNWPLRCCRGFR